MTHFGDALIRAMSRLFFLSAGAVVVLFFVHWGWLMVETPREIRDLATEYASKVSQSATFSGDLLSIQKDISLLSRIIERNLSLPTAIEVSIEEEIVAKSGAQLRRPWIYRTQVEERLPSGKKFFVSVSVDLSRKISTSLLLLLAFVGAQGIIFWWASQRAKGTLLRLTDPLSEMTVWLEHLTSRLPESLAVVGPTNHVYHETYQLKSAIDILLVEIRTLQTKMQEYGRLKGTLELAGQVAHDIRSPLAALAMADSQLAALPEDTRVMIRSAIGRIRDIANHLLERNRAAMNSTASLNGAIAVSEPICPHLLSSLIEEVLTEKRMQFRTKLGIEIEGQLHQDSYFLFSKVQSIELKRVLSNLINNSVEALDQTGRVTICLEPKGVSQVQIQIKDTGLGIPKEILSKLGERGQSYGKEAGSGLGLFHAKGAVESWAGTLEIRSRTGQGTEVVLTLPRSEPPEWFASELRFACGGVVVVLDDDESIHKIWRSRAERLRRDNFDLQWIHFSTPSEVRRWMTESAKEYSSVSFLLDYELIGFKETGLDLINELGIASQSILVTSRYEEPAIRQSCLKQKVRLMPKACAGFIPIVITEPQEEFDAILIDDDDLIHQTWTSAASQSGKSIKGYTHPDAFFAEASASLLSRDVPVYLDSSLGNGIKGEDLVPRIRSLGFKTVFLATGYEPDRFSHIEGLAGIVGKEPPSNFVTGLSL